MDACLIAIGVWPRDRKTLASIGAVAELPESDLRKGHLVLTNTTTRELIVIGCGTEVFVNGNWQFAPDPRLSRELVLVAPGKSSNFQFSPPQGTNKWRGVLEVSEPANGVVGFVVKLSVSIRQIVTGAPSGRQWQGDVVTYPKVVTREIEP